MITFTYSVPDDLFILLEEKSTKLSINKNDLIESSIRYYIDLLNRIEFLHSYKLMAKDADFLEIAEEGLEDFVNQLPRL